MAKFPVFPLWVDAYLADTLHHTAEQDGYYLRLLFAMWRAPQQRVPNDDTWLATHLRTDHQTISRVVRPIILAMCQTDGEWISHKRVALEFEKSNKRYESYKMKAKLRWGKGKIDSTNKSNGLDKVVVARSEMSDSQQEIAEKSDPLKTHDKISTGAYAALHDKTCLTNTLIDKPLKTNNKKSTQAYASISIYKKDKKDKSKTLGESKKIRLSLGSPFSDWPDDFETRFWEAYPRKTGKKDAMAKLAKVRGKVSWKVLMDGVMRYALDPNREDQFTKFPATWLSKECWNDPLIPGPERKENDLSAAIGRHLEAATGVGGSVREGSIGVLPSRKDD